LVIDQIALSLTLYKVKNKLAVQLNNRRSEYPFLNNGGEMGILINEFEWTNTSVGDPSTWSEGFRTALSIMLSSHIPMFLVWGSEKSFFYNDSFRPFLIAMEKHPEALGKSLNGLFNQDWKVVSDTIYNMIDQEIHKSEANIIAAVSRNSAVLEVYLTVGYSPLYNSNNSIEGILVSCTENSAIIPDLIESSSVRSQLNSVVMQSNAGIAQANIEGRVIEVNDRYCQMLGYTREEILKMNLGQLAHPADKERNMVLLKDCIENGNDFLITKRYVCGDGSEIWVNNSVSLVTDSKGEKYITAIAIDITAEKEKEEQLAASESRFRTLIDKAPVGTALYRGGEFFVDLANDVMLDYWKKDTNIKGQKLTSILNENLNKEFFSKLTQVYETGLEYKTTGSSIWNDLQDTEQYFDYSLTPLLDENGAVYAILNMSSNVTAAVQAQQQITASQHELATMFEQSPVAIATISTDEKLIFQTANTFYGELVGRKPHEIIGKSLLDALPELKGQGFDDLLREVIRTGISFLAKEVEVEILRKGGLEKIYVDLTYQINQNTTKEANSILVVATDVTNQVLSRREVEESETKLQNLIAAAPAGIGLFVGRDLIIEYPNQTFIDIVGKGPDIVGLPLREAMPELITEGQAYLKILDDIFTTGIPFISPASLVKIVQNGVLNDNYYNISYTPLRNKSGEIYAILDIAIDVTAQVHAQKALEESEAHLQLLRDTVPAMIFYLDEEQRYQTYNTIFMEWFGITKTEAIGKTVREFLGEAAYEKTLPHLEIAYGGEQEKYEMFAPSRMGIARWLSIVYTPHKNSEGKVIGMIVHATDITQSKLTELALRESESKLRSVLAAAPIAMSVFVGENLIIENPNELFKANLNKKESIAGQELATVLKNDKVKKFIKAAKDVYRTGESFFASGVQGINSTETDIRYHNISLTPLLNNEGKVYAVLYVGSDVTAEITSIKKIEQAEAVLRSAVEVAQLGTWSMDIATGITTLSTRHAEIFGHTETVLTSEKARSVIQKSDFDRVTKAFFAAQEKESDGKYEAEYRITHGINGQERIIHSVGQTYFDTEGKPVRINGTAQDITIQRELQVALESEVQLRTKELADVLKKLQDSNAELEQSNDALKYSNQELAQFAYVASHDLQEPLRKIQIFAGLLKEGNSGRNPESMIEKIAFSAARMSQLISDLLTFSRLIEPEKALQPVDLSEIIANIWTDFELAVAEKNATIITENLPVVYAVGLQMNQLFYNLVGNSLKFTNPDVNPQIKISAALVSHEYASGFTNSPLVPVNYYHISFSDNGIGFEKDYETQIFEIFKRLHGQNIFPGSGIGLALCRRIVMNHQGILYAESEIGKGSTFHIFLPDLTV
jgi:PAS domain S-box-containing protein